MSTCVCLSIKEVDLDSKGEGGKDERRGNWKRQSSMIRTRCGSSDIDRSQKHVVDEFDCALRIDSLISYHEGRNAKHATIWPRGQNAISSSFGQQNHPRLKRRAIACKPVCLRGTEP